MDLEQIKCNRKRMILSFAIPSVIAMVLTSFINIADGMFIGRYIGSKGIAAVNLGLPLVYLYLALGLLISVGGSSIAGRLLGAGDIKKTNNVFRQTMVTTVVVSVAVTLSLVFTLGIISKMFNVDAVTRKYFVEYYAIMLFEMPLMIIISSLGMFIRGEGNPVFVMITTVLNVLLNIILDYVFIKPLSLGVRGIALASLVSAIIVLMLNLLYFLTKSKVYKFGKFTFSKENFRNTIFNGSSEFIGEVAMCISMAAYNYIILKKVGVDGVAAFTIVGYVSYVYSMIIVGFGQGIVPLVSYSFGAGENKLAINVRKTTNKIIILIACVVFVVMSLSAGVYSRLFSDNKDVIDMVIKGLRIQMTSFVFMGINTITSFYFTSLGKAKESAVISFARGLLVLIICIFTLPSLFGMTGVWFVSLVNETITVILTTVFIQKERKLV